MKHLYQLAVVGLLVAAVCIVVRLRARKPVPAHEPAPAVTDSSAASPAERPTPVPASPPAAAAGVAPAPASASAPKPAADPAPEVPLPCFLPGNGLPAFGTWAENWLEPALPPWPDIARSGTTSLFSEAEPPGGGHGLGLLGPARQDEEAAKPGGLDHGPQFPFFKTDDTTFLGRLACGHAPPDCPGPFQGERVTEVLLGCQLEQHFGRRNKILGEADYACDPADFMRLQVRTQAAWEVLLDRQDNLSLRTSVLESSSYSPNAANRELGKSLNYSLNLMWKF